MCKKTVIIEVLDMLLKIKLPNIKKISGGRIYLKSAASKSKDILKQIICKM